MMKRAVDTTSTELSGHALMMSCPSHDEIMHHIDNPDLPFPHKMPDMPPHDLNRMMMNSANMDLGGEVTPVMALKMMRADERYDLMSIGELNDIKEQLKVKSRCYGYVVFLPTCSVQHLCAYSLTLLTNNNQLWRGVRGIRSERRDRSNNG